jgi:uncharacterized membrane protein
MIFSSWLGTYADLVFVENKMYSFPHRPFPNLFSFNISFTLFVLPLATAFFLYVAEQLKRSYRALLALLLALLATLVELMSERVGWFVHNSGWRHEYSFFGYWLFMWLVWKFHIKCKKIHA